MFTPVIDRLMELKAVSPEYRGRIKYLLSPLSAVRATGKATRGRKWLANLECTVYGAGIVI